MTTCKALLQPGVGAALGVQWREKGRVEKVGVGERESRERVEGERERGRERGRKGERERWRERGSYQAIRFLHQHFNFHKTEPIATIFWPYFPPNW